MDDSSKLIPAQGRANEWVLVAKPLFLTPKGPSLFPWQLGTRTIFRSFVMLKIAFQFVNEPRHRKPNSFAEYVEFHQVYLPLAGFPFSDTKLICAHPFRYLLMGKSCIRSSGFQAIGNNLTSLGSGYFAYHEITIKIVVMSDWYYIRTYGYMQDRYLG